MPVEQEIARLTKLLRQEVLGRGLTLRALAARLGWPPALTRQLLREGERMTLTQLFSLLEALEMPPAELFHALYPGPGGATPGEEPGPPPRPSPRHRAPRRPRS